MSNEYIFTIMPTLSSSCISRVEYDAATRVMNVTFRSGRTYSLRGVPERHYFGLVNASSAGLYFNSYLKGRY